jgi:quinol-cytochrome oxidoreductase complex cytochrome b subunit
MSALREMYRNVRELPGNVASSVRRRGKATSERARSQAIFGNLFLHIHPTRVHLHALRPLSTLGLGVASVCFFLILAATGVVLMVYYKPSVAEAYNSIKDIHYVVPTGRFIRNIHRWSAHLMVVSVLLHMARVFYTSSYKAPREWNWVVGIGLLFCTFALSFTGYLLPWDQLAYWAMTIGANITVSTREITDALGITPFFDPGGLVKKILIGSETLGEEALLRFYFLHCILLPLAICALMAVHFWRIRKDGGLARPEEPNEPCDVTLHRGRPVFPRDPHKTYGLMAIVQGTSPSVNRGPERTVSSWPHLLYAEMAVCAVCMALVVALGLLVDAPLKEIANPAIPENPAKAPWYFLGLQEIVSYSAFSGGMIIPSIVLIGLALIPYLDRERTPGGVWFSGHLGRSVTIASAVFSALVTIAILAGTVRFGWLRKWYPATPQIIITFINPGTLYVVLYSLWSLLAVRRYGSTRLGAVALFTCFLVGFALLTYFATYHRGPNWDFYWWPSMWPSH